MSPLLLEVADYTFLNRPLARLYGLDSSFDPAQAHHFQKVPLPDRRRGGLLGMGSVPTVDPDLRGATTVRDQLTKHRDSPACFECHHQGRWQETDSLQGW